MNKPIYDTYYDSRKAFHRHFLAHGRKLAVKARTAAELKDWQRKARAKLADLLGIDKLAPAPAKARMTEAVDCGDYVRQHWRMQTQRDVIMPFYLLRPKAAEGALPAVICPHGHGGGGKVAPAGVAIHEDVAKSIAQHNYNYGVQFARAGFAAFCPDARGFGQRQEKEARQGVLASSCHFLQLMGAPLGVPVAGMWVFDLMRLMDHVQRRKDVIPGRVGCAGLSGGGLQTLFFSAVDERVACAVISGYFYGSCESLLEMPGNCDCNMIPHLWESFDMGDVGGLIAPRPLLIETGDVDGLNGRPGLANVKPQVALTRKAYRLLKAANRISHDIFHGPHTWRGVEAIPWMQRWLGL